MKEQAIVIFIPRDKSIEDARKKYDRFYHQFKNHVTLVYPFKISNQKKLDDHIKNALKNVKPFKIVLSGLKKSKKDFYFYLLVKEGNNEILKLYNKLHSKLLTKFKNADMPKYIPHLTLGSFASESEINQAMTSMIPKRISSKVIVDKIYLLTFKKGAEIGRMKEYKLK